MDDPIAPEPPATDPDPTDPMNVRCMSDADCGPPDRVCETGQCVPGCGRLGGLQCSGNSTCNAGTGHCDAGPCRCLAPESCDAAGFCGCTPKCSGRSCGFDECGGLCGNVVCPSTGPAQTILRAVGRWEVPSISDTLITARPDERPSGGVFHGALFYGSPGGADVVPSYRLSNYQQVTGDQQDTMMSTFESEAVPPYSLDEVTTYLWAQPISGTDELYRLFNPRSFDHDVGFSRGNTPLGYVREGLLGHAFPRFGLNDEQLVRLSGAQIEVAANRVAGGAIAELWWSGKQFLNKFDFGRQLQIIVDLDGPQGPHRVAEAGDRYTTAADLPGWRHGSPLLDLQVDTNLLTTHTAPLVWAPEHYYQSVEHDPRAHPALWDSTVSKQVRVGFDGLDQVLQWTTSLDLAKDEGTIEIELAAAYLTADFDQFQVYDAEAQRVIEKTAAVNAQGCIDPANDPDLRPFSGGAIISTTRGDYALGVYRRRTLNPSEGYLLCKYSGGTGSDVTDFSTSKWSLIERPRGGLSSGRHEWRLFVVAGTRGDVIRAMDQLYDRDAR